MCLTTKHNPVPNATMLRERPKKKFYAEHLEIKISCHGFSGHTSPCSAWGGGQARPWCKIYELSAHANRSPERIRIMKNLRITSLIVLIFTLSHSSTSTGNEITSYTYDSIGRLINTKHTGSKSDGLSSAISYDGSGNITSENISISPHGISVSDSSASEGGYLTFNVSLTAPSNAIVTVSYGTSDGTAKSGVNYAPSSGSIVFQPGETSKNISILTSNDGIYTGNESFYINLSNPNGAILNKASGSGTIIEASPVPVVFSIQNASPVTEGGVLVFNVTKSPATSVVTTVNYSTSDGTAQSGSDYIASSGTLSFSPNETVKTISIQTIDDSVPESTETLFVNLSSPVGGSISVSQGSGNINDNDTLPPMTLLNPSFAYVSSSSYSIPISQLVNVNGHNARILSFSVPSGHGSASLSSDGQSVVYYTETVAKPGLCEPSTYVNFTIPYAIQDVPSGGVVNGSAAIRVQGPAGARPTGHQQCP